MPQRVACPYCRKELAAPDELAGQVVSCPHCASQFQVPAGNPADPPVRGDNPAFPPTREQQSSTREQAAPLERVSMGGGGGADSMKPVGTPSAEVADRGRGGGPLEHVSMQPGDATSTPTETPSPAGQKTARFKGMPAGEPTREPPPDASSQNRQSSGRSSQRFKESPATPPASSPPAEDTRAQGTAYPSSPPSETPTRRGPRRAKFITADDAQSRIEMGADGQLPELALDEGKKVSKKEASSQSHRTWLLVLLLTVCVGSSVAMLFIDETGSQTEAAARRQARADIFALYRGEEPPFEDYQILLREARWAHLRGDDQAERQYYRRVLDMLHAEDKDEYRGLTGVPEANQPPNDQHLRKLLTTLLSR